MGKLKAQNEKGKTTPQRLNLEEITNILLENRGITSEKDREEFFEPRYPDRIRNQELGVRDEEIQKAVDRIQKAIKDEERIAVYGDYDVDGVTACSVLWETLHFLGARALPYIPSRFTEGYGLNTEVIKGLKRDNPDLGLLVTVDHGITAGEKVDMARELGVDVIITDHHQPEGASPGAYAVVHTTQVSGSAVAWILAQALVQSVKSKTQDVPTDHLGLVALGTVADVLPLVGFNRSFVVHGLEVLRKTERPGVVSLCREASIDQARLEAYHIGFGLAPRLNAMGRLEHAMDSLRLLCTRSVGRARDLAFKLGRVNKLRQEKTTAIFEHLEENFGSDWRNGGLPKLLFAHHGSYDEGIIGIVAGRLVDKYYRPAVVVSQGDELSKASARSVSGVDIVSMIRKVDEGLLVSAGGHKMAAGFTVKTESLEDLKGQLLGVAEKEISEEDLVRRAQVDMELPFEQISEELAVEVKKFAPFGFGNPEPAFLTKGVFVEDARLVGRDRKHLKMRLKNNEAARQLSYEAIGFGMGGLYSELSPDKPVDVVYSVVMDEWNDRRSLQLKVKEIKIGG